MQRSAIYLLAGGPGSDVNHQIGLLRKALVSASVERPSVAYVGAASGDDAGFLRRMTGLLQAAGAGKVVLAPTCGRQAASGEDATRVLESSAVVFVSGGDVEAGMQALQAADLVKPLRARFDAGVSFIGLSAGSVMLGREWIAWRDSDDDATAQVFPCLGFVPFACDAHGEGDAWSELATLVSLSCTGTRGYGISAPAMLKVHPDGRLKALGGSVLCLKRTAQGVREALLS